MPSSRPSRSSLAMALVPLVLAGALGCGGIQTRRGAERARPAKPACAGCIEALRINGWCETSSIGYVAAVPIPSQWLHEALDAHGHEIPDWSHPCLDCNDALLSDGYCPHCKYGFVDGKLYFTKLTWSLGLGTVVDLWDLDCLECATHPTGSGWCDDCARGLVGNVAFTDRAKYECAAGELDRLHESLTFVNECERCALSHYMGIECRACLRKDRDLRRESPPRSD